jgi:spore maturation protein CgeB
MRPFELAAFGSCIVSQPYNGIEEWFEPGKELFVVRSEDETIETYQRLLRDRNEREQAGSRARERVLSEHTYKHRADELITIIQTLEQYTGQQ